MAIIHCSSNTLAVKNKNTHGHSSSSSDRTRDDSRALRLRWTPEHSIQTRAPKLRLAQSGPDIHHIRLSIFNNYTFNSCNYTAEPINFGSHQRLDMHL